VDLTARLIRRLRRHQLHRRAEALRRGRRDLLEWVSCTAAGTPLDESRVRKAFAKALQAAVVSAHRVYDLRHTFASVLLARGVPLTYVSAQTWPRPADDHAAILCAVDSVKGECFIDAIDESTISTRSCQLGTENSSGAPDAPEAPDSIGGPSRTRTLDPLIKSQLLYQLS
jgi:hypothetical protein